jgi:hypothetical protein
MADIRSFSSAFCCEPSVAHNRFLASCDHRRITVKKNTTAWIIFFVLLVSTTNIYPQATPIQRDQKALAILAQTILSGGGVDLLTSIKDLTETGAVTYYFDDQTTGTVTTKSRGLRQFKLEADLSIGKRTVIVNGSGGSLRDENGGTWPIDRQSAADIGSMIFPYLPLIAAVQDSSTKITYGGLVTHNGASVHDIRIERTYTSQQDPTGARGTQEARDIYIDPTSLQVVAIFDQFHSGGAVDNGIPHEILYSNYQSENGIAVPLSISETMRGETRVTIQQSSVTFNTGLADSDFE